MSVGVIYPSNGGAAAAGVGVGGGGGGETDPKAQAAAVIAHVNRTGGVGGREVKPVYHEFDFASSSDQGTVACTRFTQDEKVFAVVTGAGGNTECLAKKGVVFFSPDSGTSEDVYGNYPDFVYGPSDFAGFRQVRMYVDGWVESGQLKTLRTGTTGPVKIGVVVFNISYKGMQPVVDGAFAKHGLKVAAYGRVATDSSNIGTIVNDFKAKGITHVMTPGYGPALFMNFAASQAYRPLYGLASSMQPTSTATVVPADQLEGSIVVGWRPTDDVKEDDRPDLGAAQALCKTLMSEAGQPYDSTAATYCDLMFSLQRSLKGASVVNTTTLRRGYEAVGEVDSVVTFRAVWRAGRLHDGGAGYRLARYQAGCLCFRYDGPVRPY